MFGDAEVADYENQKDLRDSITKDLASFMKDNFAALDDKTFSDNGEARYQELQKYFTFMYR